MRIKSTIVYFVTFILVTQPSWGWGVVGHQTVGRIAAALLTPAAREKVADILGVDNTKAAVADAMADAAEWPDLVARNDYPESAAWHFIDLGLKPNPALDDPLWASPDTAFARIVKYIGTVKLGAPDDLEPGSDLKFLVHLVGDVHQPLHVATDQDRGGNCLFMKFIKVEGGKSPKSKFHSAWDTTILQDRLGKDDRTLARQLVRKWKKLSQADRNAVLNPPLTDSSVTVKAWLSESHDLAVTQLYGKLTTPETVPLFETATVAGDCHDAAPVFKSTVWMLDDTATEDSAQLMEQQLMKAGARLAALLNAMTP